MKADKLIATLANPEALLYSKAGSVYYGSVLNELEYRGQLTEEQSDKYYAFFWNIFNAA